MKVTIIGPVYPYRGGIAHHTTLLVYHLQAFGHYTNVISFRRQYPGWLYPGVSDIDPSKRVLRVDAEYLLDPFNLFSWFRAFKKILGLETDIVLFPWWTTFWAPAFSTLAVAIRRKGLPVCFLVHNVFPHDPQWFDRILTKMALCKANGYVVQSQNEKKRLLGLCPSSIIEVCNHPVYDMFSDQNISKSEARILLNLPVEMPLLLFFGLIRPYKGLLDLLEAVSILKNTGEKVNLLVAGEFWEDESYYLSTISKLGISEQVNLKNHYIPNEELSTYFSAADVLVAPYTSGSQSGSVNMAAGFGLPVILTDVIADSAPEGVHRIVVPSSDPSTLAKAISECLRSKPSKSPQIGLKSWELLVSAIEKFVIDAK